jgi:hypothetical protein
LQREIKGLETLVRAELKEHTTASTIQFQHIKEQFSTVEARRLENKEDTKEAVDRAFQAAAAAIKEQTSTFSESIKGLSLSIDDLKSRVGTIEAVKIGSSEFRSGVRLDASLVVSVIVAAVVVIGFFLAQGP